MHTKQEQDAIENLIHSYSSAFNAAEIGSTVALFTPDGILMPANAPSSQGREQLTRSFDLLLKAFRIRISYTIDEIAVNGNYAYARTNSLVSTHVNATGQDLSLRNKELFLLRKEQDNWKISHYIFNNTSTTG